MAKTRQNSEDFRQLMATRIFVNFAILSILAGLFFLISEVTAQWTPQLLKENQCQNSAELTNISVENFTCFAIEYLPSIVVTMSNLIAPFLFGRLILLTKYEENPRLLLNLAYNIFLRLASIFVALFSLQQKVN